MKMKMPKGKYMCAVKIGDKGQIVIPKPIRDMFELEPGDSVMLMADQKKGVAIVPYEELRFPGVDMEAEEE